MHLNVPMHFKGCYLLGTKSISFSSEAELDETRSRRIIELVTESTAFLFHTELQQELCSILDRFGCKARP